MKNLSSLAALLVGVYVQIEQVLDAQELAAFVVRRQAEQTTHVLVLDALFAQMGLVDLSQVDVLLDATRRDESVDVYVAFLA